jgi:hypothetical protein
MYSHRATCEAALRDERDPLTPGLLAERPPRQRTPADRITEAELRALWGDR